VDPRVQAQLKVYDEALALFHQQKFAKSKQARRSLERPQQRARDRARIHRRSEQGMKALPRNRIPEPPRAITSAASA